MMKKKIYSTKEIAETIENYESLKNSLTVIDQNYDDNLRGVLRADGEGYMPALILPKKMYYEIKGKVDFIEKCIKTLKDLKQICIVEARMKGLEYDDVRKYFQMHDHTIRKHFDKVVLKFHDSQFDVPPNRKKPRKKVVRRTKAQIEADKLKELQMQP